MSVLGYSTWSRGINKREKCQKKIAENFWRRVRLFAEKFMFSKVY